jgi:CHAT domain-containing protein
MSLWGVDDDSTRQWMGALYEARLIQKMPTAEAVHEASMTLLRQYRLKGISTHPFYWAGFVASGDWR